MNQEKTDSYCKIQTRQGPRRERGENYAAIIVQLSRAQCFKQIWKVGKVGMVEKVGTVGKVGKVVKVGKVGKVVREGR